MKIDKKIEQVKVFNTYTIFEVDIYLEYYFLGVPLPPTLCFGEETGLYRSPRSLPSFLISRTCFFQSQYFRSLTRFRSF